MGAGSAQMTGCRKRRLGAVRSRDRDTCIETDKRGHADREEEEASQMQSGGAMDL